MTAAIISTASDVRQGLLQPQAVLGKFRYVAAEHTPQPSPHNFHLPAISEFGDERLLPLHDMRPLPTVEELPSAESHAQLGVHGFTAIRHPTVLHSAPFGHSSWKDPGLLREYYIPDTIEMMKQVTGCKTVITEGLLLRSATWTESDALATHGGHGDQNRSADEEEKPQEKELSDLETGFPQFIGFNATQGGASPAPKIHLDYAPDGARKHIRYYHPELAAAAADIIRSEDCILAAGKSLKECYHDSDGPRWALFSIWRPIKSVKRDPLALGDQRTFRGDDYVPVTVRTPYLGRPGVTETHDAESYLARYSEGHKWHWVAGQQPEEVLVIGLFDSHAEKDGGKASGGTLHSSVDLPGTEDEEARESIELRCLCIW
ncbi:GA4 desaturase [Thozetella sp. PMI_491]|nr:GA4 desaturase [Thozetella sp. PMI_491]